MAITIDEGRTTTQDPNDFRVYQFDWDTSNLAAAATISTSAWTLTTLFPSGATALTKDNESIVSGSRKTQVRLSGGSAGATYKIDNQIVTNESPAQTKNRHFLLKVEDR